MNKRYKLVYMLYKISKANTKNVLVYYLNIYILKLR